MNLDTIYESLCVYDPRSPFYQNEVKAKRPNEKIRPPRISCPCEPCSKGTDKLALEIIRLRDGILSYVAEISELEAA